MRELTDHIVEGDPNPQLRIEVLDDPGAGGASHYYKIEGFDLSKNPSKLAKLGYQWHIPIFFQNGPIQEFGINGISHEALLAIVIDRLRSFQAGPPCEANEVALGYPPHMPFPVVIDHLSRGISAICVKLVEAGGQPKPPSVIGVTGNLASLGLKG